MTDAREIAAQKGITTNDTLAVRAVLMEGDGA